MQCIVTYRMQLICICMYIKLVLRCKFLISDKIIQTLYIYANKNVRIRGYLEKIKGVHEQISLENSAMCNEKSEVKPAL